MVNMSRVNAIGEDSIYGFEDYREFLRSFYDYRKASNAGYSYKRFSEDAGIVSPNLLKLVIDGKKNLTTNTIQKFAKGLHLKGVEVFYFETLVHYNQATDKDELKYYSTRLSEIRRDYSTATTKVSAKFGLYDHPYLPAIFALLARTSVVVSDTLLQKQFGSAGKWRPYVEALLREGVFEIRNGLYDVNVDHYIFQQPHPGTKLKKYLADQLRLSKVAFDTNSDNSAKFYSHAMSLNPENFASLQEAIKDFVNRLNKRYEADTGSAVQINIQSFTYSPKIFQTAKF